MKIKKHKFNKPKDILQGLKNCISKKRFFSIDKL